VKSSVGRSSYSGKEQLEAYKLPTYVGGSQTVKQIMLTPFAVAVDATIVGAVIGQGCIKLGSANAGAGAGVVSAPIHLVA
jgi:hypothetical protein